jgi:hypothetical protein
MSRQNTPEAPTNKAVVPSSEAMDQLTTAANKEGLANTGNEAPTT